MVAHLLAEMLPDLGGKAIRFGVAIVLVGLGILLGLTAVILAVFKPQASLPVAALAVILTLAGVGVGLTYPAEGSADSNPKPS